MHFKYLDAGNTSTVVLYTEDYDFDPDGGFLQCGLLTGVWLESGNAFNIELESKDAFNHIVFVPEPTTLAILAFGSMFARAMEAADRLDATAANMRFVKPLDEALVLRLADSHDLLVTLEENVLMGGAGSAVGEFLNRVQHSVKVLNLGLPDCFIEQASVEQQLQEARLDLDSILGAVSDALGPVEISLGRKRS